MRKERSNTRHDAYRLPTLAYLPTWTPMTSPEMMISTLRFFWRPSAVLLLATGMDCPKPLAVRFAVGSPCSIR